MKSFSALAVMIFLLLLYRYSSREVSPEAESIDSEALLASVSSPAIKQAAIAPMKLAAKALPAADVKPLLNEAEFQEAFKNTDFMQSVPTLKFVETLESQWQPEMALYFTHLLESIGSSDASERGRVIFLANELRSADFVPLWTQVLERKIPAFDNEGELIAAKEPNVSTMSLRSELATAVRNLGLLAYKDPEALESLKTYVSSYSAEFDNAIVRKDAYYRIREVNPTLAARTLSRLSEADPLRKALSLD
ncbi:MAG: hypothetical protein EOP10_19530 [Proteobacteria bacterium]|nr:MAG: hypothetical protein EOP10_19530 [Pseudomonadota bacterium]